MMALVAFEEPAHEVSLRVIQLSILFKDLVVLNITRREAIAPIERVSVLILRSGRANHVSVLELKEKAIIL